MAEQSRIVELRTRPGYRPVDLRAMACEQVAAARQRLGVSRGEFASLLAPLLGWPVNGDLVEAWETKSVPPGDVLVAAGLVARQQTPLDAVGRTGADPIGKAIAERYCDVVAVFASRDEFVTQMPPLALFEGASRLRMAGLSLNLLCQQFPDAKLRELISQGTHLQCLFLDPVGEATRARDQEEGHPIGSLGALTQLNIEMLTQRVRDQLPAEARDRVELGVYDETIRVNLMFVGDDLCVAQWYLPDARGVDSPTFVVHRPAGRPSRGLFPMFEQVFNLLWSRRRPL